MTILTTERLTRRYGDFTAVDALTLTVEPVKSLAYWGRMAPANPPRSRCSPPCSTRPPVARRSPGMTSCASQMDVRRNIGYVPQALSADGNLTGFENLLIFARLYDLPRRERGPRIRGVLDFMGLSDAADRLVKDYSGGMIRRLEVAQAMLHRPRVLFLDEPTVGLDPVARRVVWEHLRELRADSAMTIFLTTHYMEEAESLCHRRGHHAPGEGRGAGHTRGIDGRRR